MVYDVADLERRVRAGEWLLVGETAALLGYGRTTVHEMISRGEVPHRMRGIRRLVDPAWVTGRLDEDRRVRGG